LGVVPRRLPTTLVAMIISVLIASAIGLLLVLLVQGSMDSWFVAVLASAVMAMVIGQYVDQLDLVGLW